MRMHRLRLNESAGVGFRALLPGMMTFLPSAFGTRSCEAKPLNAELGLERRGLLARIDDWFWRQQQRQVDAYLAKAADIYDLEARMRALERRNPYPYY